MATSKVVAPKIEAPKALIVSTTTREINVNIKTPLGLNVSVSFDSKGYCDNLEITPIDTKKPKYTCTTVPDMLMDVIDYTDAQFEELVSIAREVRRASKEHKK